MLKINYKTLFILGESSGQVMFNNTFQQSEIQVLAVTALLNSSTQAAAYPFTPPRPVLNPFNYSLNFINTAGKMVVSRLFPSFYGFDLSNNFIFPGLTNLLWYPMPTDIDFANSFVVANLGVGLWQIPLLIAYSYDA